VITTIFQLIPKYMVNVVSSTNPQNVCPTGWHIPAITEWTTLENYLIDNSYNYDGTTSGNKISKSLAATITWNPQTNEGVPGNIDYPSYRNKTGFTGFAGGYRNWNGNFNDIGSDTGWWSSTMEGEDSLWDRWIVGWLNYLDIDYDAITGGMYVRCLKD
jgi:uncharacterized protein (TIGR02145 family)